MQKFLMNLYYLKYHLNLLNLKYLKVMLRKYLKNLLHLNYH